MEIKVFNSSSEELIKNKQPIFIGISVGIKPMTFAIATAYLNWAALYSSEVVQILIADEIASYNYLVFSHYTKQGARSRAIRDGDIYEQFFEKTLDSLPLEKRPQFNILRWKDIKGERFLTILKEVKFEFDGNVSFQMDIFAILDPYIKRRGKEISERQKIFLAQYLLEELATILDGIYFDGKNYRLILYPTYRYSGMSQLVSDIQHKRKYASLCVRLYLSPTVMVESLIENDN